jgi:FkbM family methyltransferase
MKWYFFKTLREKQSIIRKLKKGNAIPFLKYLSYRFHISPLFHLKRRWYTMRVFYSPYAFWLWTHEDKEKNEELFFESFLQLGDTVIDCGAHIGTLTITASKLVGEGGRVISYEAHPRTFRYLKRNVEDNACGNVTVHNLAIGDKKSLVSFSDYYASDLNAIEEGAKFKVQMVTLDEVLKDIPKIDLLKLDIEGSELLALLGAKETLKKTKAIYFESAEKSFSRFGYALKDIVEELKKNGFSCYVTEGKEIKGEVFTDYTTKIRYENIIAVRTKAFL